MLYFGCIDDIFYQIENEPDNLKYDEIWLIVRQLKPFTLSYIPSSIKIKHIPDLAPSENTFFWARKLIKSQTFTDEIFSTEYIPRFLSDIKNNSKAQDYISFLKSTDKNIFLGCYCKTDKRCHRKIIQKIINGDIQF